MFVPLKDSNAPPVLIPVVPLRVNCSKMLTPASCSAAPTLLATVVPTEPRPSAPLLVICSAPALIVTAPDQMSLLAARTSVPLSFLENGPLGAPKAEFNVRVVLAVTSKTLLAAVLPQRLIVRLLEIASGVLAVPP